MPEHLIYKNEMAASASHKRYRCRPINHTWCLFWTIIFLRSAQQEDPPDCMFLAVGQAVLACLKCGWDPKRGTNILQPAVCNDQNQGEVRGTLGLVFWRQKRHNRGRYDSRDLLSIFLVRSSRWFVLPLPVPFWCGAVRCGAAWNAFIFFVHSARPCVFYFYVLDFLKTATASIVPCTHPPPFAVPAATVGVAAALARSSFFLHDRGEYNVTRLSGA